jgi:hypothetical protein
MFRASNDGGQIFGDKKLSNTTDAHSTRVEITSDVDSVVVTWWETNHTSDMPKIGLVMLDFLYMITTYASRL